MKKTLKMYGVGNEEKFGKDKHPFYTPATVASSGREVWCYIAIFHTKKEAMRFKSEYKIKGDKIIPVTISYEV